jgi:isopenicillin-N N-acyltransferase-like protein
MGEMGRREHDPMRPVALVVALVLFSGCAPLAKRMVLNHPKVRSILSEPQPERTVSRRGQVQFIGEQDDRITVLYVGGTPYEMGYEHGRLLGREVKATIRDVMKGARKFLPKPLRQSMLLGREDDYAIINELLDRAWARMAPYTPPEDLEEMRGLADGSGIPLQVIQRMHAIPDLGETSCSALVAKGAATRDGHVYQLRILDYGANFNLQRRPLITVYRPNGANAFVNIGWIGFVGVVSGVNEKGVALSEMGFGDPPGETLAGMPMPFLLKQVLRYADTAEQGAAIIRAAPRTNSYVYFLGDRNGGAIGMITSAQQALLYRANEQQQVAFGEKLYPQFRDVLYAGHYQDRQAELVRAMHGSFDVDTIMELARQISMKSNLHTVIYDLSSEKIWVANRKDDIRASDRPYVEFSLREAWSRAQQLAAAHPQETAPAKTLSAR